MARIRTIKPEFPQSESMGRVSRDARLLFVMLWPICDDHGRTRAASRMLASLLFPYDDDAPALIGGWLDELERENCIRRYESNGSTFLVVCNWLNHQKIDKPSKPQFPEPPVTLAKPREDSSEEGKGREGKGEEQGGKPPLSPASADDDSADDESDGKRVPQCPHTEILTLYAEKLPELPQPIRSLWADSKGAEALRARWRWVMTSRHEAGPRKGQRLADSPDEGIAWFGRFFDYVRTCPLLMGEKGEWHADLSWLVTARNFAKVLQGNYEAEAA